MRQAGGVTASQRVQQRRFVEVSQLGQILCQIELRRIGFDDFVFVDRHHLTGAVQLQADTTLFDWSIADGVQTGRCESIAVLQPDSARFDPFLFFGQFIIGFGLR